MQYETIILELMSRIKKLEDEVELIKENLSGNNESKRESESYGKLTDEMIEKCYVAGKKTFKGGNARELADGIAGETGMNPSSAFIYIHVVCKMLNGEIYKRAISRVAMELIFNNIHSEFGTEGLKQAIKSARLHIEYRRKCGHKVDSIEIFCDKYEKEHIG